MSTNEAQLRSFLADSLELWRVAGTVEAGQPPVLAVIRTSDGTVIRIEPLSDPDMPFRWIVRETRAGDEGGERPHPCGSLVGVLSAMRVVLGVNRGSALRVASSPSDQ